MTRQLACHTFLTGRRSSGCLWAQQVGATTDWDPSTGAHLPLSPLHLLLARVPPGMVCYACLECLCRNSPESVLVGTHRRCLCAGIPLPVQHCSQGRQGVCPVCAQPNKGETVLLHHPGQCVLLLQLCQAQSCSHRKAFSVKGHMIRWCRGWLYKALPHNNVCRIGSTCWCVPCVLTATADLCCLGVQAEAHR